MEISHYVVNICRVADPCHQTTTGLGQIILGKSATENKLRGYIYYIYLLVLLWLRHLETLWHVEYILNKCEHNFWYNKSTFPYFDFQLESVSQLWTLPAVGEKDTCLPWILTRPFRLHVSCHEWFMLPAFLRRPQRGGENWICPNSHTCMQLRHTCENRILEKFSAQQRYQVFLLTTWHFHIIL